MSCGTRYTPTAIDAKGCASRTVQWLCCPYSVSLPGTTPALSPANQQLDALTKNLINTPGCVDLYLTARYLGNMSEISQRQARGGTLSFPQIDSLCVALVVIFLSLYNPTTFQAHFQEQALMLYELDMQESINAAPMEWNQYFMNYPNQNPYICANKS